MPKDRPRWLLTGGQRRGQKLWTGRRVIRRHRQGMSPAREETAMDDPRTIKVMGFAGSLRKGSYNRMVTAADGAMRVVESFCLADIGAVCLLAYEVLPLSRFR